MSDDEAVFKAGQGWGSPRSQHVLEIYDDDYRAGLKGDKKLKRELTKDRACDKAQAKAERKAKKKKTPRPTE